MIMIYLLWIWKETLLDWTTKENIMISCTKPTKQVRRLFFLVFEKILDFGAERRITVQRRWLLSIFSLSYSDKDGQKARSFKDCGLLYFSSSMAEVCHPYLQPDTIPGDVVFVLHQKEHPKFNRKSEDLYVEHSLSLTEALCGFQFLLTHLDGRQLLIKSNPGEIIKPGNTRALHKFCLH